MIIRWKILEDPKVVAQEACRRMLAAAKQAIATQGYFRVVLAGGKTPLQAYQLLSNTSSQWQHWHVYFGDERCLPENDNERNSTMVTQALLKHVPIPANQIHTIPAHLGATEAAHQYTPMIAEAVPFDLVLLGVGEDGHTASLFPDHQYPEGAWVHAVFDAPKPPPERVSLSVEALCDSHAILALVTGLNKQEVVKKWRLGEPLPITQIRSKVGVDVLIDHDAHG